MLVLKGSQEGNHHVGRSPKNSTPIRPFFWLLHVSVPFVFAPAESLGIFAPEGICWRLARDSPNHRRGYSALSSLHGFGVSPYFEQGSLKDTFCNHLKHGFFHKNRRTPPFARQCSGV